ncbi:MAG: NFACT family protein [Oliverpabstia sp.]
MVDDIRDGHFEPNIVYKGKEPVEFACFPLSQYQDYRAVSYPSIFPVLETYYAEKKYCHKDASENSRSAKNRTECTGAKCKKISVTAKTAEGYREKKKNTVSGESC